MEIGTARHKTNVDRVKQKKPSEQWIENEKKHEIPSFFPWHWERESQLFKPWNLTSEFECLLDGVHRL